MRLTIKHSIFIAILLITLGINNVLAQVNYSGTTLSGTTPSAIGTGTKATGNYSFSAGYYSEATNQTAIALGYTAKATGNKSVAIGELCVSNLQGYAFGQNAKALGQQSLAIGRFVETDVALGMNSIVLGSGNDQCILKNNIGNSLMVGFNSTVPTLFVGQSTTYPSSFSGIGRVGIGTSSPLTNLHILSNTGENALLYVQNKQFSGTMYAGLLLGNQSHGITADPNNGLMFKTQRYYLFNDGNVGIGTGTPATKLHVNGDVTVSTIPNNRTRDYIVSTDETGKLILIGISEIGDNLGNHIATQNLILGNQTIRLSGGSEKVIGPDGRDWTPGLKFHNEQPGQLELGATAEVSFNLNNYVSEFGTPLSCMYWTANSRCGGIGFGLNSNNKGCIMWDQNNPQSIMTFIGTKVGIGCDPGTSKHRLFVKDGIVAEEVLVKLQSQWSDYVLNADYDLMPLNQLSDYITQNQHLPDIPTAKEVDDNGINVGEMNALLLKKVEELTLYIIDQQKQIDELKAIICK